MEIEHKFLVADDRWRSSAGPAKAIRQFYLSLEDDRSVRVRIYGGEKALLTLKFGKASRMRDEFEYPIPLSDASELERYAIGRMIQKKRYEVKHEARLYEIDVFLGDLRGLVLAEVETAEEIPASERPVWIGREVTGEEAYYNATLARNGLAIVS